jgi:hypothetical protein
MIWRLFMFKKLLPLLLLFTGFQANAVIIDQTATTLDTDTGFEWLDMSYTDGISYAAALAGSNLFEGGGWRNASYSEVVELASNAVGYDITSTFGSASLSYTGLRALTDFMGATYESGTKSFVIGNVNIGGGLDRAQFGYISSSFLGHKGFFRNNNSSNVNDDKDDPFPTVGTFLVRSSAVPEPSIIALFGLGLVGIGFARRRRQS